MQNKMNKKGFTLIELSIVLLILFLITGGIIGGGKLIEQAKYKKVLRGLEEIATGINTFFLEYNNYPGDMPNFMTYHNSTTCTEETGYKCNGNGDGIINFASGTDFKEGVRAFQHMHLAEIYSPTMTGLANNAYSGVTVGVNVPSTAFASVGYSLGHDTTTSKGIFVNIATNAGQTDVNKNITGVAFTPLAASMLEMKAGDDDLPKSGKWRGLGTSCANADDKYDKTNDNAKSCAFQVKIN